MAKKIVCVRDSKTEVFGVPVVTVNLADAERMFKDLVLDSSNAIGKHPEDYTLYCLGSFDETIGAIDVSGCPFAVCSGSDFVNKE